jgi:hypothetical protein
MKKNNPHLSFTNTDTNTSQVHKITEQSVMESWFEINTHIFLLLNAEFSDSFERGNPDASLSGRLISIW